MSLERIIKDLVIANRILANEGVLDSFGHVSVRHPTNPDRYLLARSCSPGIVGVDDIVEFTLDGKPVGPESRPLYLERHLHGGIYETHPSVNAVLHAHSDDMLPFTVTDIPMRPVIQSVGDMGEVIPVWDIADKFGDDTDLLVCTMDQGRDLAHCLLPNRVALLRSHGFVSVDVSLIGLVRLAIFLPRNARVLLAATALGKEVKGLKRGEIAARLRIDPGSPSMRRGWEYWALEAGCNDLL
jgi:ribulose-5-phosphate 4-epimerase/fuculose-1-phosphate aldolase